MAIKSEGLVGGAENRRYIHRTCTFHLPARPPALCPRDAKVQGSPARSLGLLQGCAGKHTKVVKARRHTPKGPRSSDKVSGTGLCLESQR